MQTKPNYTKEQWKYLTGGVSKRSEDIILDRLRSLNMAAIHRYTLALDDEYVTVVGVIEPMRKARLASKIDANIAFMNDHF